MGKRGPKPKPTAIRKLEGNPGRLPINELEPAVMMPVVKPGVVITDEIASLEWDRLINAMPPGIYTAADVAALANYALAWSMLVKAQMEIDANGVMLEVFERDDDTGKVQFLDIRVNPAVKVWKTASETLLKLTDRLGLTPGVRSRLQLPSRENKPPASKFGELMGRK